MEAKQSEGKGKKEKNSSRQEEEKKVSLSSALGKIIVAKLLNEKKDFESKRGKKNPVTTPSTLSKVFFVIQANIILYYL